MDGESSSLSPLPAAFFLTRWQMDRLLFQHRQQVEEDVPHIDDRQVEPSFSDSSTGIGPRFSLILPETQTQGQPRQIQQVNLVLNWFEELKVKQRKP
jgi:hypothetical protein